MMFTSLFPTVLADAGYSIALVVTVVLILMFFAVFVARRYKRCPSNRIMVVYGRVAGNKASKCLHGGGCFIWPLVQDYQYLSLEPMAIDIELTGALSKKNIRVNVPSTFTIGISTAPEIVNNAAERLLGLTEQDISTQARDIILGQMRLVIATLAIEEINQDREKFLDLVNKNVGTELNKVGLDVINVNIRDITDESGYIEAIGRKAAAEAIQQAKVEVAQQERMGAIGEATAVQEKEVSVANQRATSVMGQKQAERNQRISVSKFEAEGVTGEASAQREKEVAVAQQKSQSEQGKKQADTQQRVAVAQFEATAVQGENDSRAKMANYNATLMQAQAEAKRTGEVALANATRDVLKAEAEQETARLEKTEVVQREIDKRKIEIDAEAEAERTRRIGKGAADAVLFKYTAEAEGVRRVLEGKASGYQRMLEVCGAHADMAPTLLLIEKLPELVAEQVKAIQNLKIDKVTVWDSGGDNGAGRGNNATANWLKDLIGALPPIHDLARQAGVKLPGILGTIDDSSGRSDKPATPPPAAPK
jgi:flotillin